MYLKKVIVASFVLLVILLVSVFVYAQEVSYRERHLQSQNIFSQIYDQVFVKVGTSFAQMFERYGIQGYTPVRLNGGNDKDWCLKETNSNIGSTLMLSQDTVLELSFDEVKAALRDNAHVPVQQGTRGVAQQEIEKVITELKQNDDRVAGEQKYFVQKYRSEFVNEWYAQQCGRHFVLVWQEGAETIDLISLQRCPVALGAKDHFAHYRAGLDDEATLKGLAVGAADRFTVGRWEPSTTVVANCHDDRILDTRIGISQTQLYSDTEIEAAVQSPRVGSVKLPVGFENIAGLEGSLQLHVVTPQGWSSEFKYGASYKSYYYKISRSGTTYTVEPKQWAELSNANLLINTNPTLNPVTNPEIYKAKYVVAMDATQAQRLFPNNELDYTAFWNALQKQEIKFYSNRNDLMLTLTDTAISALAKLNVVKGWVAGATSTTVTIGGQAIPAKINARGTTTATLNNGVQCTIGRTGGYGGYCTPPLANYLSAAPAPTYTAIRTVSPSGGRYAITYGDRGTLNYDAIARTPSNLIQMDQSRYNGYYLYGTSGHQSFQISRPAAYAACKWYGSC